ncbi:ATP-binding protein [Streptomyces odonnellii]|uniref:ATP-binding protein n=1 Tax=Streptomyces odonnellii TaxID=1417980 RepID=UPI000626356E|nr:LuxR family transcriptional regulator [Streptomyces odonnellii]
MLLERETELARVSAALRAAREGTSASILLSGPLGIGRSALLRRLPALCEGEDVRVLRANAAPMEEDFAFGVVRQLFDSAAAGAPDGDGTHWAREAACVSGMFTADGSVDDFGEGIGQGVGEGNTDGGGDGSGRGDGGPATSEVILHGPRSLTAGLGENARLLILVDDLQWVDTPSLRWLAHLVKRLHGLRAVLVCALRDGEPRTRHPLVREIAHAATRVLRPEPLSLDATRTLVRARHGRPAHEEYARACHEASGGNPLFLMSVLRGTVARGLTPTADHSGQVRALRPAELRERLASHLRTQAPAVRKLAAAIAAFGDHADPALVAQLAGLDETGFGAARRALHETGLLTGGREPRFTHRVVRDAVESSMTPAERERSHAAAADLLYRSGRPAEQVAAHLMAATGPGRPWTVPMLRSAADTAVRRGAPETAARYLRRALLAHRTQDAGRARLLIDLATVERGFDPGACERHIVQAVPLLATPRDRAAAALRIPPTLLGAVPPATDALLRAAAAELGAPASLDEPTRELALRLEARLRHHGHENPGELASAAERLRDMGDEPPLGSAAERELVGTLLCAGTLTGRLTAVWAARTANRVLEREPATSAGAYTGLPLVVITLFAAESIRGVTSWLSSEQQTRRQNTTGADGVLLFAERAMALAIQGRPAQAREYAERALGLDGAEWREPAILVLSAVALELRDPAFSERILDRAHDRRPAGLALTAALQILQASVDAQRGHRAKALESVLACGRRLETSGWRNSALFPWRPQAIGLHHRLGDSASALRLAEEEHTWTAAWGAPTGLGRALRLKGWLHGSEGVPLLREAVGVLRGSTHSLELARTLVLLGRRLGSGPEAESALREAGALAAASGAPWLVEQAEHGLGTPPPPPRTAVLTRSERRVVSLVGRGLTNQEIAGELGVSSRAVEKHLTNSYRKLGISGRHELADALPA